METQITNASDTPALKTFASIRADIYDIEAHLVCQLASNLPAGPSLPTLQWDGKTDSGETLHVGRYIVYIESLDYNSGTVSSGKKVIVLAR